MTTETMVEPTSTQAPPVPALLPVYDQLPFTPVRGEGVWLWDADGRRVLDLWGGHAVALLGHAHPRLLAACRSRHRRCCSRATLCRCRSASRPPRGSPPSRPPACRGCSSSTAAPRRTRTRCCSRLRSTGRHRVVAVEGAFHGRTAAAGGGFLGQAPSRLSAAAVRGHLRAARRSRGAGRRARLRRRGVHRRAGAGRRRRLRARPRLPARARASSRSEPARC